VVYVRGHEGRGIGLAHKLAAYALQDQGLDTVDANEALGFPADARTYDVAGAILADLGLRRVRLLTNNPAKSDGLVGLGIEVVERVPLPGLTTEENLRYLQTKRERMAHVLDFAPSAGGESA
jgi:3,4-dihydroxy 2-butanone 4-phosphate synthase/GTP cyclohydrolase II